jgi:glutathione S-transferase
MKPELVTFAISHYCEKARWALDWLGVDYAETACAPGWNVIVAKLGGAKRTTVPFLVDGKRIIEESGPIIDWADEHAPDADRRLTVPGALEIERRADDGVGVHARRLFYSLALPGSMHMIKPAFLGKVTPFHKFIGSITWLLTPTMIRKRYKIRPGAAEESRAKLEAELDWLDGLLADGRPYLAGDHFSRADITVASLLAPLIPPEHAKTYHDMTMPDVVMSEFERWKDRPILRFVAERYRTDRAARGASAVPG